MSRVTKVIVYYVLHVIYAHKNLGPQVLEARLYRAIYTSPKTALFFIGQMHLAILFCFFW